MTLKLRELNLCNWGDYQCENYREGTTLYCASHNLHLRKMEKELLKPTKITKRIRKVSDKKQEKLKPYAILRRQYLNENPVCEANLIGCEGNSVEIHHCHSDEAYFLKVHTWKAVCRFCHSQIETKLSAFVRRKMGLLIG